MDLVQRALCDTMLGRSDHVDWDAFTAADWRTFQANADADGVLPLIRWSLDRAGWPAQIPADVRLGIQLGAYVIVANNRILYAELLRILQALAEKMPTIVLKGAALGPTLYPHLHLRPLSDLDLLIPLAHRQRAEAVLATLGYRQDDMPELASGTADLLAHHVCMKGGPQDVVAVELHWRLIGGKADRSAPPVDWFWEQTEPLPLEWIAAQLQVDVPAAPQPDSQAILQLSPSAQLLHLAAHLMLQHGAAESRLIWLYDLHLLITRAGMRLAWPEVVHHAQQFHWSAGLHAALELCRECFGTPVPDELFGALEANAARWERDLIKSKSSQIGMIPYWRGLQWLPDRSSRLHYMRSMLFPSKTFLLWRYPEFPRRLWPLLYPYRLGQPLVRAARMTYAAIRRPRQ